MDDLVVEAERVRSETVWSSHATDGATGDGREVAEVEEGELHCVGCGRRYRIAEGIPRMAVEPSEARRSAHVDTVFDAGQQWEEAFRDFAEPLGPEDFLGKLALDVGCGFGRGAYFAARYGAEVVALDVDSEIVRAARDNTRHCPRVHVVEGSVECLPFRASVFDLVYAFGVMHHVDKPDVAFEETARVLDSGGRLSVWVYGPRQGTAAALSSLLRGITREMPSSELLNVSRLLASALRLGSHTPYRYLRRVPMAHSLVSHLPLHDHFRWPYDVVVADIYDRLRIPVVNTFTREELEARYMHLGFLDIQTSRRVRNNESFRATGLKR